MFEPSSLEIDREADEWAIRSEFWHAEIGKSQEKRRRRERNTRPLILCGHGVSLRIENRALVIRDGFTHYPQRQVTYRFFPGDLELPPRILLLDGSGTLSFDVLSWFAEQGVALARVKWTGEVAIVAGGAGYVADLEKVRWQHETRAENARRAAFACDLICRKLTASIVTLETFTTPSSARENAIAKAREAGLKLRNGAVTDIRSILQIEGECAVAYFKAWREVALSWTGLTRHPIPETWQAFRSRSSILTGRKPKNWKAAHPINAMLNYAYAVKAAQLQIDVVASGLDPFAGIMHHAREGFPAYVYDMIEPERPKVDAAILKFIAGRSFAGADFILRKDGVCRLSPQLARTVATTI